MDNKNIEKVIDEKIKQLETENVELERRLFSVERRLQHVNKICDILFPLLFGMFITICVLVF